MMRNNGHLEKLLGQVRSTKYNHALYNYIHREGDGGEGI